MANVGSGGSLADRDRMVEEAQATYLGRCAKGYSTRRIQWSGGATQLIELGDGPPVLLVHGGLGEAFQWGPVLAPLAGRYRVFAVDRPGHGLADPFDYRGVDLFAHARQFLGDIMDTLDLRSAPIVASSMGGLWSVVFALKNPERVPRLVLIGSTAGIKRELPLGLRIGTLPILKTLVHALMKRPNREAVRNFAKQILVVHPERLDNDFLDVSVASQKRNAPSWFTLLDRTVDIRGMKEDLLLHEDWRKLSMPTTMIWGEKDAFGPPSDAEAIVKMNPRIRLVRIPDAGHAPWMDQRDQVVEAILEALKND